MHPSADAGSHRSIHRQFGNGSSQNVAEPSIQVVHSDLPTGLVAHRKSALPLIEGGERRRRQKGADPSIAQPRHFRYQGLAHHRIAQIDEPLVTSNHQDALVVVPDTNPRVNAR